MGALKTIWHNKKLKDCYILSGTVMFINTKINDEIKAQTKINKYRVADYF